MAFHDMNGAITIDEGAANADIAKMQQAIAILEKSQVALKQVMAESETMKGQTPTATYEKAAEMLQNTQGLINSLKNSQAYIRRVVQRYKALDMKYAAMMASKA